MKRRSNRLNKKINDNPKKHIIKKKKIIKKKTSQIKLKRTKKVIEDKISTSTTLEKMNALEKEIVSVAISSENEKEIKKYSFRRRITQMKENPELFKESWGIFEEEDAFNKKYNKGNRNNWLDSLEDWSEKAYRKKKNKKKKITY